MATYLFWDPVEDNIVEERDDTGALVAEYTTEPSLYGNVISQIRSGAESQFHYDAQGSLIAITDDNHNVTDTFAYTAFGEDTEETGAPEVLSKYIGQKGYYRNGVAEQYMIRMRLYDPTRARWLSADFLIRDPLEQQRLPMLVPTATHLYAYLDNNAINFVDPSGLQKKPTAPVDEPAKPGGRWECAPTFEMAYTKFEGEFTYKCETCTESCAIRVYGQRCFHESATSKTTDREPLKAFTLVYIRYIRTERFCGDKELPDTDYRIGACELYPLRLIAPGHHLDKAIEDYLKTFDNCGDLKLKNLCAELKKVPVATPF